MRSTALNCSGALALAMLCAAADTAAGADRPLPYRVLVVVEWGHPTGPASFLADLEQEIVTETSVAGCFREVRAEPPAAPAADDLRLRVTVHAYEEETEFEFSEAERANPGRDLDRLMVAHLQGDFHLEMSTLLEQATVRESRFRRQSAWRPVYKEDPREEARRQLIEAVARTTRRFACKGSAGRWSKQIERARAARAR